MTLNDLGRGPSQFNTKGQLRISHHTKKRQLKTNASVQHIKSASSTHPSVQHIKSASSTHRSVQHEKTISSTHPTVQFCLTVELMFFVLNWRFLCVERTLFVLNWQVCWTDAFLSSTNGCVQLTLLCVELTVFCVELTFFCFELTVFQILLIILRSYFLKLDDSVFFNLSTYCKPLIANKTGSRLF